jgi:glycosyltransferase involved in cell wall biosynthesis
LNSIPRREDIQIIVIDDNSDENKVDFAHFPCLEDKFVDIYFAKEGKGAGYARNVGLDHVKGKWLLFADADDFFTDDAFDYFYSNINSLHEILYFKTSSCYSDTNEIANRNKGVNRLVDNFINNKEGSENQIRYRHLPPWGKMIRVELIRKKNILFEEIIAANDRMFSIVSGHLASSVGFIDKELYCVTVTKGSIGHTVNFKNLESKYITTLRCNNFVKQKGRKDCQYSILPDLFMSRKYGICVFFNFLQLAILYKNNPFIGMKRGFSNALFRYKEQKKNKKYIIEN